MSNRDLTEGFILESYQSGNQGVELPMLWQVLFQESSRSNHILFDKSEIEGFDFSSNQKLTENEQEILEMAAADMITAGDITAMRAAVARCTPDLRKHLFVLYQSFMQSLGTMIRESLN